MVDDSVEVQGSTEKWRQPSLDFDQDIPKNRPLQDRPAASTQNLWSKPQSLLSSVGALQKLLSDKFSKITLCPKKKTQSRPEKVDPLALVPYVPLQNETRSNNGGEGTPDDEATSEKTEDDSPPAIGLITNFDEADDAISTPTIDNTEATNTKHDNSAAETRSLHIPDDYGSLNSAPGPSSITSAPHTDHDHRPLKIFGLILIILSLLIWCVLRWKDPRWRVDRAARREERRNRRLYKRAARKHMINTWIWNFRLKFNLVSNEVLSWDEKRARVSTQEEILEDVMKQDIRALRNAHRVVSNITAAEEGQNEFEYEANSSERRRSMTTLPGYESEGSQPPSYEASRSFQSTTLVGSSVFAPADIDSNPDSSVVSTSPRISRDGTNSEFDEKIEVLSLEPNPAAQSYRV